MKKRLTLTAIQYQNDGASTLKIMRTYNWKPNKTFLVRGKVLYILSGGKKLISNINYDIAVKKNDFIIQTKTNETFTLAEDKFYCHFEVDKNDHTKASEDVDMIQFDGTDKSVSAILNLKWPEYYEIGLDKDLQTIYVTTEQWMDTVDVHVSDYVIRHSNGIFDLMTETEYQKLYSK